MQTYLIFIIIFFSFLGGIALIFCLDFFLYFFKKRKGENLILKAQVEAELIINKTKGELKIQQRQNDLQTKENHAIKEKDIQDKVFAADEKTREIESKKKEIEHLHKTLKKQEENHNLINVQLNKNREALLIQLEKVSGMSQKEATQEMIKILEKTQTQKLNKITKDRIDEAETNIKAKVNRLLADAVDRYAKDYIVDSTIYKIDLPSEEIKGKIIGKQGRNIKSFEELSGVDVILESNSPTVKLSCFNPVRRTIALNALKKLIQDGRIQPQKIKETLETAKLDFDNFAKQEGENVANELKITDLHPKLIYHLGLLKFRTSYGQNVLQHSIETAKLAGALAVELNLNDEIAIRAGLLHDIGKAKDYEMKSSHVTLGVELAQECQENEIIINAIHAHHEDVPKTNVYSVLVSIADTLSAARPGAREHTQDDYFKRMKKIEEICNAVEGVRESYAVKSGRVIRIIVDASKVNDFEVTQIAENVKKRLKTELQIPGDVTIEVVRELKVSRNV